MRDGNDDEGNGATKDTVGLCLPEPIKLNEVPEHGRVSVPIPEYCLLLVIQAILVGRGRPPLVKAVAVHLEKVAACPSHEQGHEGDKKSSLGGRNRDSRAEDISFALVMLAEN